MAIYSQGCWAVGSFRYAGNFTLYVELIEQDVNVENNTSKISYNVYCKSNGSGSINARHYEYFKLNDSVIIDETVNVNVSSPYAYIAIASGTTGDIAHNSDGTKTVNFEAQISGISYGVASSISGTFTLTSIPRKSTVSATAANIGGNCTVSINRASSSFTHTLTYSFGNLSGTIANQTSSTNVNWTLPDSFYSQIPNAKSGTGTITCTTYNGGTSLGSNTCTFVVNAVENDAKPIVTATVTDINSVTTALTGDNSKIVLNASTARIVITSTLRKNAGSINNVTINGISVGNSANITQDYFNVNTGTFTIITTDSRGYSTTIILSPSVINYIPLTLNANVFRPSPVSGEVSLNYTGNCFNGSFGVETNTLTVSYQYKLITDSTYTTGTVDISPTITNNTYEKNNTSLGTSFTYTNSYNFIITVTDKIKSVSYSTVVNKGEPVFYWGENFFKVNGHIYSEQKVLAAPDWWMLDVHTLNLSEKVSEQNNGIILVWSGYSGGQIQNYNWTFNFIPKQWVASFEGSGTECIMAGTNFNPICCKYVYIYDTKIVGSASNDDTGINNGISYDNTTFVLRYVLGV